MPPRLGEVDGTAVPFEVGANFSPDKPGDDRNPIAVANPCSLWNELEPVVLARAEGEMKDGARETTLETGSGEIHLVRFAGRVEPDTTTPPAHRE